MSLSWNALHAGLRADIGRHRLLPGFNALSRGWAALSAFPEPQALLDHQHRASTEALPDHKDVGAVHLRDGGSAIIKTLTHVEPEAELLRAAICDDELIQAIGRGRGINRTDQNQLEVQVLADVALPLMHDRVLVWETLRPGLFHRMLLAGLAVDSPTDAALLHRDLFGSANEAKLAFARVGFKGQNPIGNIYREMTLKSAAYRREGRGRSWQRAWWISGSEDDARRLLQSQIGVLEGWKPS